MNFHTCINNFKNKKTSTKICVFLADSVAQELDPCKKFFNFSLCLIDVSKNTFYIYDVMTNEDFIILIIISSLPYLQDEQLHAA